MFNALGSAQNVQMFAPHRPILAVHLLSNGHFGRTGGHHIMAKWLVTNILYDKKWQTTKLYQNVGRSFLKVSTRKQICEPARDASEAAEMLANAERPPWSKDAIDASMMQRDTSVAAKMLINGWPCQYINASETPFLWCWLTQRRQWGWGPIHDADWLRIAAAEPCPAGGSRGGGGGSGPENHLA